MRRALTVVSVECWWRRSGCREWSSCWAESLVVGGDWWSGDGLICTFVLVGAVSVKGWGGWWLICTACLSVGAVICTGCDDCWWLSTLCIGGVVLFT